MVHQPASVVSQCSLNAWLSGWLAEISADLREAVAHYRRFTTMRYTNLRTLRLECSIPGAQPVAICSTVACYGVTVPAERPL